MKTVLTLIVFGLLLIVCWPLALFVLVLLPLVWLPLLPFCLLGVVIEALTATIRALLFLPARLLGYRGH